MKRIRIWLVKHPGRWISTQIGMVTKNIEYSGPQKQDY